MVKQKLWAITLDVLTGLWRIVESSDAGQKDLIAVVWFRFEFTKEPAQGALVWV